MKKSIIKITTFALAVLMLTTSCDKLADFGNTNTNPAATNSPNTAALLTNVLSGFGGYSYQNVPSLYCQYFSETQYPEASQYSFQMVNSMANYSGLLYDLQNIIITNTNEDTKLTASLNGANENQIAIATILKAYIFWVMTDRVGDLPYKTALNGDPAVSYESQESIYKGLIQELTDAMALFVDGAAIQGDLVYNGNIAKWKKMANSMRMLMALRLSKKYPGSSEYAATQFKAALADPAGHISSNDDNFALYYPGGNFRNPYYGMYDGRKDYGESKTMTDMLTTLANDPRSMVYGADVDGNPSILGVPYGWNRTAINDWCSNNPTYTWVFDPDYRMETSPLFIVKASTLLLARAEAADRGWTSETANTETLYQAGITASFEQWGLAAPDAMYFTDADVDLTEAFGTGANLAKIATQTWVAFYPDGVQGWANWRRTGYPVLTPAPDATNDSGEIPRRYAYSTNDYSLNGDSVKAAVVRQWGDEDNDTQDERVWWDK